MTYIIGHKKPTDVIFTFNGYEQHLKEESAYRKVLNMVLKNHPHENITILVPNKEVLMPNLALYPPQQFVGMLLSAFEVKEPRDFPCAIKAHGAVQYWPCALMYHRAHRFNSESREKRFGPIVRVFIFEQSCTQMIQRDHVSASIYWKNFGQ